MAILIDPPLWPAHDRLWSHLVSDSSFEELHAFARAQGVPGRGFEGDHYDVPQERYAALVAAGAHPVPGRELLRRLRGSGLRRPKRRGERVLASHEEAGVRVDVLRSALAPPWPVRAVWALVGDGRGVLAVPAHDEADDEAAGPGWRLPSALARTGGDGPSARPAALATGAVQGLTAGGWADRWADRRAGLPGWRQVGYLRPDQGRATAVELVLRRDDVTPPGGPLRPPARWVEPAELARWSPRLAPLLDAVLSGPDTRS